MRIFIAYILACITVGTVPAFSEGQYISWNELQETSDFIALGKAVVIEEVDNHHRTTFSIIDTYKGNPPEKFTVQWQPYDKNKEDIEQRPFIAEDLSRHFILFAKKEGDRYSLSPERYLPSPESPHRRMRGKYRICLYRINDLPPELDSQAEKEKYKEYTVEFIEWDLLKNWLHQKYKADQQPETTTQISIESEQKQGSTAQP